MQALPLSNGMSIQEKFNKFKSILADPELFTTVLIVLVAFASFGLGRISMIDHGVSSKSQKSEIISHTLETQTVSVPYQEPNREPGGEVPSGGYVASKNGTKYHLPWCSGAKQMKEENKIWFQTKEEAEAQGYAPAANCKGI